MSWAIEGMKKKETKPYLFRRRFGIIFRALSEQILNDHTSLNLYCSEKEEPILIKLTYHNSKLSEKKRKMGETNSDFIYLEHLQKKYHLNLGT